MTSPQQWQYVPSEYNPADTASRPQSCEDLMDSIWFKGPESLRNDYKRNEDIRIPCDDLPEEIEDTIVLAGTLQPVTTEENTVLRAISLISPGKSLEKFLTSISIIFKTFFLLDLARKRLGIPTVERSPKIDKKLLQQSANGFQCLTVLAQQCLKHAA